MLRCRKLLQQETIVSLGEDELSTACGQGLELLLPVT